MPEGREPLARRLADGSPEAFADLYDRFGARLYHYLLGQTRSADAAEDLAQTVMLRLVRSRKRLRGVENLRAYVFTIARNELMRAREKRRVPETETPVEMLVAPESGLDRADLDELRTAVAALSPQRLEVVSLKLWQGLTFAEIGEVLGISPNTAASRYRYALENLRERMEAFHE
jgi:RNA polymerase sigma-70 factor, ECF subfamily